MRRFLSWTLLACLLLASEARIDNAFGTEIEKHGHQKKEAQHLDPNPEQAIEGGKVRSVDDHNIVDYGGQSRRTTKESQSESDRNVKQQNSHNNEGQRRKWSLSKYASEGKAAGKWKAWKNQSKGKHKQDAGKCSQMKCTRKQVCLVNGETGVAECIPKRILRQSRKTDKSAKGRINRKQNSKKKHPSAVKLTNSKKGSADKHKKAHRIAKKIKNKAEKFQNKYQEKKRHHLHHLKDVSNQKRAPLHSASSINSLPLKPADTTTLKYCSQKELDVMGKRLLDWFKVLQDQSQQPHIIQKRNSKKKELHEQDECICQAPVRSEFLRLDKDQDDKLSVKELEELKTDSYEHCMKPFIKSCDHNRDGFLSDREWCCCFADVLPPCLAELKTVPAAMTMGAPAIIPGAFVPQCDSDGFYKPVQCHGSTGYCWCVDRNGVTLEGTHTRGMPKCEAAVKEETAYDKELPQLK